MSKKIQIAISHANLVKLSSAESETQGGENKNPLEGIVDGQETILNQQHGTAMLDLKEARTVRKIEIKRDEHGNLTLILHE